MNAPRRRFHRVLGLALTAPLVLWIATGLLFHIKHRYAEAYETLRVPVAQAEWAQARISPADLVARGAIGAAARLSLTQHPSGRPVYAGSKEGKPVLLDAANGESVAAASPEESRRWVEAALAACANRARYGDLSSSRETMQFSARTGLDHPAYEFAFSGGKTVTIDRLTGEMAQTGELNDWIDFTYRLHYLQWTPWQGANIALVLLVSLAVLALAFTGLRIFFGK